MTVAILRGAHFAERDLEVGLGGFVEGSVAQFDVHAPFLFRGGGRNLRINGADSSKTVKVDVKTLIAIARWEAFLCCVEGANLCLGTNVGVRLDRGADKQRSLYHAMVNR